MSSLELDGDHRGEPCHAVLLAFDDYAATLCTSRRCAQAPTVTSQAATRNFSDRTHPPTNGASSGKWKMAEKIGRG